MFRGNFVPAGGPFVFFLPYNYIGKEKREGIFLLRGFFHGRGEGGGISGAALFLDVFDDVVDGLLQALVFLELALHFR